MKTPTKHGCISALLALGLALNIYAAEPLKAVPTMTSQDMTWTLATDDTELTLAVVSNRLSLIKLRNPARNWNWIPTASRVPLPGVQIGTNYQPLNWEFREATEGRTSGHQVSLRFTCANPALELKSVWRAHPGPGPVENEVSIKNTSRGDVTFGPGLTAAGFDLVADSAVTFHRADKTAVGKGKVQQDVIGANATFSTGASIIPFIMLDVGTRHGAYFGFEWELGGFKLSSQKDALRMTVSAHPITENVIRAIGEMFLIPSVYYGTYQGDIDDGSNRFKRWFWNHKITRSLHDNKAEPWVEVCMQEIGGTGSTSITGKTRQSAYDRLAANGAECVKMDFWDGSGKCWYNGRDWMFRPEIWPNGFDFAAKAHHASLKASLYMGGTYQDCDLTTLAGRDAELEAVLTRYDQGWFDIWRTDLYTAPREPMPQTYQGVANFLFIQDHLIKNRPGYRYENCCNGGKYKGFAICRRMTFCTMNDSDQNPVETRTTYFANTFAINPVQLKSDLGPANDAYELRTDMLGAILTWAADNPIYRQHIALYKSKQRPILRGADVYHLLPMADGTNWDGLQFFNPDLDQGSVFLFKPSAKAADGDSKVVKIKGLDRKATYALVFQDRVKLNCSRTGAQLRDEGITVSGMTGDRVSEIIWIEGPASRSAPAVSR
ncbi:MAG: GH36 C-terminal domain-containing protein [Verrucomicrobia bacterium]|nr:GH36 C-terminal domain-containing protein [Verrucomicrobiota bacterium]